MPVSPHREFLTQIARFALLFQLKNRHFVQQNRLFYSAIRPILPEKFIHPTPSAPTLVKSTDLPTFCTCFHRFNGHTVANQLMAQQ
ncbi:MAG TPA: hypothetical protein VG844_07425 [Terracidiphilus sp.]|nr:hypothetical protein [Terracidiphilus sp.]